MKYQLLVVLMLAVQAWGACPSFTVIDSLELKKFMGLWYQYASCGKFFLKGWDRCVKSDYTLCDDGKTITINNTRVVNGIDKPIQSTWVAVASDPADGHLTIEFKVPILGKMTAPLNVLDTDYDTYAVLCVCKQLGFIQYKSAWLFTRNSTLTEDESNNIFAAVEPVLEKNGFDKTKFALTSQENCDNLSDILQHWDKVVSIIKG
uniref:Lipocalin/cytosolic fatty-acid binding domain-containing protein n=1 Tax=Graphocephala atropunctata TaxID=36148 RepID=A0A1B6KPX2_9HEMI